MKFFLSDENAELTYELEEIEYSVGRSFPYRAAAGGVSVTAPDLQSALSRLASMLVVRSSAERPAASAPETVVANVALSRGSRDFRRDGPMAVARDEAERLVALFRHVSVAWVRERADPASNDAIDVCVRQEVENAVDAIFRAFERITAPGVVR